VRCIGRDQDPACAAARLLPARPRSAGRRRLGDAHQQRRQGGKAKTRQAGIALPTGGPQPLDITSKNEGIQFGDAPNLHREKAQGESKEWHYFFPQETDAGRCPIQRYRLWLTRRALPCP